jgi:hypothetical protein
MCSHETKQNETNFNIGWRHSSIRRHEINKGYERVAFQEHVPELHEEAEQALLQVSLN